MASLPSHLPDLCLENIFKRIPLSDLLRSVRAVCTNWWRMVPTELNRRRSLVLFRNQRDVEKLQNDNPFRSQLMQHVQREDGLSWETLAPLDPGMFNALFIPGGARQSLDATFVSPLMDTLPSITHLTVAHSFIVDGPNHFIPMLQQLVRLITFYGNRLVSLKLYFHYPYDIVRGVPGHVVGANILALFDSINQAQSLRHLTWNVYWPRFRITPRLSILSRLNTFIRTEYLDTPLLDCFIRYATGHIRLVCELHLSLEKLIELNRPLSSKFTTAIVSNVLNVGHYDNMCLFGDRFTSISRLELYIDTMPMTMLARCLSPLVELIDLRLAIVSVLPSEEIPQAEFVQIASVRVLKVDTNSTRSHLFTERLYLAQLFPNLQVLDFYQRMHSCEQCDYVVDAMDGPNFGPEQLHRLGECMRLAREPLKRCANLHTIYLYGDLYRLLARNLITGNDERE